MWTKIYLIALAVAVVPMIFLTYYSYSWLRSIGAPMDAIVGFRNTSNIAFYWLWITTAILIILANLVLWNYRKAWALWSTLGYLVVFLLLRAFWLQPASNLFIASNNLPLDTSVLGPLLSLVMAAVAAVIVYFNQLAVIRMRERPDLTPADAIDSELVPPQPDLTEFDENEESR